MLWERTEAYARWQNPITSMMSLIAGLLLAIGHHLFYLHLDGKLVHSQSHFIREWAVSIGTAFAFLAHSSVSVSIGITFWQLFWSTLHKKSLKLSTIDSLADSWKSLLKLLNYRVIKASPQLVFLALTGTVIIPVAVVFPPGTLRVKIIPQNLTHYDQTILAPTWNHPKDFGIFSVTDGHYLGPTRNLIRSSAATAYQMDLPQLPTIKGIPNATYEVQMYTPTIQCRETSSTILSNFTSIFNCSDGPCGTCGNKLNRYTYLAWAPLCNKTKCAVNTHADILFNGSMPSYIRNIGTPGYGPAQMYISTLHGHPATDWMDLSNWRTLNCSLYNASQVAQFVFHTSNSSARYDGRRMEVLNAVTLGQYDQIAVNTPIEQSYLAIMDALGGLLAGTVLWNHDFEEWSVRDTIILDSKLAQTAEVSNWSSLNDDRTQWNISTYNASGRSLAATIEELFHNMTLSLFAHSDFTDPMSIDVVHSHLYGAHFWYSPRNLLLSYGCALSLTAVIAVLGYRSVVKEGKSYSNRLSTVIRTTQNEHLNAAIDHRHRGGEDPLPKHLAQTKVQIAHGKGKAVSFAEVYIEPGRDRRWVL